MKKIYMLFLISVMLAMMTLALVLLAGMVMLTPGVGMAMVIQKDCQTAFTIDQSQGMFSSDATAIISPIAHNGMAFISTAKGTESYASGMERTAKHETEKTEVTMLVMKCPLNSRLIS